MVSTGGNPHWAPDGARLAMVPTQLAKWLTLVFLPSGGKPGSPVLGISQLSTPSLGNVFNRRGLKSSISKER